MSSPQPSEPGATPASIKMPLRTIAIRVAIGSLIAAAILCAVWVMFGGQDGIITRALLTIALFAAFAGVALFDARAIDARPQWYSLASMVSWVFLLLAGAVKIWMPWQVDLTWYSAWNDSASTRFAELLGIAIVVRLALLHTRIFLRAHERYVTTFTTAIAATTTGIVWVLAAMLVLPMLLTQIDFGDFYWRSVVALTILGALGSALIPLLNAINVPRKRQPVDAQPYYGQQYPAQQYPPQPYGGQPYPQQPYPGQQYAPGSPEGAQVPQFSAPQPTWPTYVDGVTPLPVMPDGSPDYNAYYTGYPTYPAPTAAPVALEHQPAPVAPAVAEPIAPLTSYPAPESSPAPVAPEAPAASPADPADPAQPAPPAPPVPPVAPPH